MDPERWRRVNEVFHDALEHRVEERSTFLDNACTDDAALRAEVESLLASHAEADDFIETPAFETGAELLHGASGEEIAAFIMEGALDFQEGEE